MKLMFYLRLNLMLGVLMFAAVRPSLITVPLLIASLIVAFLLPSAFVGLYHERIWFVREWKIRRDRARHPNSEWFT